MKMTVNENKPKFHIPHAIRMWLYGIAVAVAGLLIGYGVITAAEGGLWLSLIVAVLAIAPAVAIDNISEE